ncbi:TonB-dependent receptor [Pontibacter qinzhouensis]|uniref:TonB-dependent receptor n=1 Tax=Pontibacter qinzhouensis TaxID=2603253 RepID=A0A5C8KAK1_9BACT|nr:TonB-dependent receptor [Pontibacter qinzhouensis]TXK49355.1 TonB-dependent receptor [Pontibacter qinzhouensis]
MIKKNLLHKSSRLLLLLAAYGLSYPIQAAPRIASDNSERRILENNFLNSQPQQTSITGRVTSQEGEPLPGVTVVLKGTSFGSITDLDGNFSLSASLQANNVLVFSFVGYQPKEVPYKAGQRLQVVLTEDAKSLSEVVVVGYGTQKKSDLTGSVGTVSKELIEQQPVSSIDRALQGAAAGVQVTQTSGQPGGGVSIRIRGGGSIQGGNEPLYVIDGFPLYNNAASAGVTSGADVNPLASINPSDIESMHILKDASATAIYGSRGANGVIIITTKKGAAGTSIVSYEGSYGLQALRQKIDLLNASEFAQLRNEALQDRNPAGGPYQYLAPAEIAALGTGTDWQDAAFHQSPIQNHQISISGGNEKTRYALTGGYFGQDGIIRNTDFKRLSARINLDSKITDKFNVGLNLTGSRTDANLAPSGIVSSLLTMPPTATIYEADGNYTFRNPFENLITNPIASLFEQTNKTNTLRVLSTIYGEYTLLDGLVAKVSFGTDITTTKDESYIPRTLYEGIAVNGQAAIGQLNSYSWLNENTLTYRKESGKHSLNALLGFTQQEFSNDVFRAGSQQFVSDDLTYNSLQGGATPTVPYSDAYSWSLISYLGRLNYFFDQRYFFTASLRADGSSRFGKNNKWGYFPSVAFAWKISNENFFTNVNLPITDFKFRTSFGATGNQEIGMYQSLSTLSSVRVLLGEQITTGFRPDRIANDNLGWETTYQFDSGIDLGLFENRLLLTVDGYYKKTVDLLLNVQIPWTSGHSSSLQNFGAVENRGLEFGINTVNIDNGALTWNSSLNLAFNRNKVLKIGDGQEDFIISGDYIIKVGEPLGSFYGSVTDGVLQPGEVAEKGNLTGKSSPKAGDRLYKDVDNNGTFSNAADRAIIGNAQPDYFFGLTNNIAWKGLDLSVFLQGSVGNQIVNKNRQSLELFTGLQNAAGSARDRWSPSNTDTDIPRASSDPSNIFSNRFVEDGSYIRLKNITLGYTLPVALTKWARVSNARLFITGQNLLTWTSYTGYDPEVTSTNNTVSQGTDQGVYPVAKTVTTGVKVTF